MALRPFSGVFIVPAQQRLSSHARGGWPPLSREHLGATVVSCTTVFSSGRAPALLFHRVRGLSRDLLAGSTADQGSKLELRLEEGCAAGRVQSTPRAHGRNCRTTREAQATAARNLREARTRQGSLSRIQ